MKKLFLLFALLFVAGSSYSYKIISKNISDCSRNLRCGHVVKTLCTIENVTGWCIDCWGGGSTKCNRSTYGSSTSVDVDNVDVTQSEILFDYVEEQIDLYDVLVGSHAITVYNVDDQTTRVYTITWNLTENQEGEISGNISIDKIII